MSPPPPLPSFPPFLSPALPAVTGHRENIIQGQQDYHLTPLGVNQAEATAARLRSNKYWQAHSSDLVRASRTAEIITQNHIGTTLLKTPLLREFGLGVYEDLPRGTSWWVWWSSSRARGPPALQFDRYFSRRLGIEHGVLR